MVTKLNKDNAYSPEIIISLLAIMVMSSFFYGARVIIVCAVSSAVCWLTDIVSVRLHGKTLAFRDYSAVTTGLIIALMMPASVKYSILAVTCVFAIVIGKQVFGGSRCEIFDPAAVGYVFAALCWPLDVLRYPSETGKISLANSPDIELSESFSALFNGGGVTESVDLETFLGNYVGPFGCSQIIVVCVCAVALVFRHRISISTLLGFFGTYMGVSILMPALTAMPTGDYIFYEFSSNMLVFSGVFIVSNFRFAPQKAPDRIIYGIITAVLTLLFRRVGDIENPTLYAVLLANPFVDIVGDYRVRFTMFVKNVFIGKKGEDGKPRGFLSKTVATVLNFGTFMVGCYKALFFAIGSLFGKKPDSTDDDNAVTEDEKRGDDDEADR